MFTNITRLKGHIPDNIYNELLTIDEIDGPKRCSHFLGQIETESMFTKFTENLNYSANRLMQVFPKYFTTEQSIIYANKPEKIANRVYANRMGNGDEQSGDGWKYRGRGAIQLTGKDNYKSLGTYLGADTLNNPDLVATTYPMKSAAWYFTQRKLWTICDQGVTDEIITTVSEKVNGGTIGHDHRKIYTYKYWNILQNILV